jgi:hypothetical protein
MRPLYHHCPRAKYRDDRMMDAYSPPPRADARQPEYRSLCISNISSKIIRNELVVYKSSNICDIAFIILTIETFSQTIPR